MRWRATLSLLVLCFSALAVAQPGGPEQDPGVRLFNEAQTLSYEGRHDEVRPLFKKYKSAHPDDLLAPLRLGYDYLLDSRPRTDEERQKDYEAALALVNDAIGTFEKNQNTCVGTDIIGIGKGTIDCQYVAAALYSLREALVLKNEKNNIHEMDDDRRMRTYAESSGSPQARFLLGAHEYEASKAKWNKIPVSEFLKMAGIPVNRDHAFDLIGFSLAHETVFSDDTWFYVLKMETDHWPDFDHFSNDPRYAVDSITNRLKAKYPDNGILK